jgi:DNA-binding transcriptional MerR regulator
MYVRDMTSSVTVGLSPDEAAERAGITYRQLTHWVRSGYLTPSGPSPRVNWSTYTDQDIEKLRLLRACSETGWQPRHFNEALLDVPIATGPGYLIATHTDDLTTVTWVAHHEMPMFVESNPGPHVIVPTNIRATNIRATLRRRETRTA